LVDSSVWIDVLRDTSGLRRLHFDASVRDHAVWLARWTQLELLQGARDERE